MHSGASPPTKLARPGDDLGGLSGDVPGIPAATLVRQVDKFASCTMASFACLSLGHLAAGLGMKNDGSKNGQVNPADKSRCVAVAAVKSDDVERRIERSANLY